MFGMANQFIRDLSANTSRGLHHKAQLGYFPGTAPVGYLNDVRAKTIVIDRKKSKFIKSAFELYAEENYRLEDISNFLFENNVKSLGGLPIHKDRIRFILTNPFYYGHFRYAGEIYEGKHVPIIDKKLFDKVADVIVKRGHPQRTDKTPKALCGLIRCGECGCMITAEEKKGYIYYRCTKKKGACSQAYVREEILVTNLSEILTQYVMPKDWTQELLKLVDKDEKNASKTASSFVHNLQEQKNNTIHKLDRLTDVYVEQDIARETYLAKKRELMSEKKSVEEKIAKLQKESATWLEPMREWIKDVSMLDEIAKSYDLPSKKLSLQKIFGSNLTLLNKKIEFIPIKPYASLREARENFPQNDLSLMLAGRLGFGPR